MQSLIYSLLFWLVCVDAQNQICSRLCSRNEVYTKCGGAIDCQKSCTNDLSFVKCDCIKGCKCRDGYVRNPYTNECIRKTSCESLIAPKCPNPHEEWSDSTAGCQRSCSTLDAAFKCPPEPGCVCKQGFVRSDDESSPCIPVEECKTGCPKGYTKNSSGQCELDCVECSYRNEIWNEDRGFCTCLPGMERRSGKHCVCPQNEVYSCKNPFCEDTCKTLGKSCTIFTFRCEDRCYCKEGYVRDPKFKRCVSTKWCDYSANP